MSLQRVVDSIAPLSIWSAENGAYIGIPLLLVLTLFAIRNWRSGLVRFAAAMGLVALILSLGPTLQVDGHSTGVPLPFRLITSLPLMGSVVASRLSFYVALFGGLLLALGMDRLRTAGLGRVRPGRPAAMVAIAAAVVALIPVIPAFPYQDVPIPVPEFFATDASSAIPDNSVLLTYPYPEWPYVQPMYWQAIDGYRYKSPGGYLYTLTSNGSVTQNGTPTETSEFLQACEFEDAPPATSSIEAEVANDLRYLDISTIVVTEVAPNPECALQLFTAVLGTPARQQSQVWVWTHVQSDLIGSP
jgi:hypothetical protein